MQKITFEEMMFWTSAARDLYFETMRMGCMYVRFSQRKDDLETARTAARLLSYFWFDKSHEISCNVSKAWREFYKG